MLLIYYINLVKYKKIKNFDSPKLLECLIIWNWGGTYLDRCLYVRVYNKPYKHIYRGLRLSFIFYGTFFSFLLIVFSIECFKIKIFKHWYVLQLLDHLSLFLKKRSLESTHTVITHLCRLNSLVDHQCKSSPEASILEYHEPVFWWAIGPGWAWIRTQ